VTAATLLGAPLPAAVAKKAAPSAPVAAKQAESAATKADLDQLNADLAGKISAYQTLVGQIQTTRDDVSANASELAGMEAEYAIAQERLNERAVFMYKDHGDDLVTALLGSRSIDDFIRRAELLLQVGENDAQAIEDAASARNKADRMRIYLAQRQQLLVDQQQQASVQRDAIVSRIKASKAKLKQLAADIVAIVTEQKREAAAALAFFADGSVPRIGFTPDTVITDKNYLASGSMSAQQIQAFLDRQPGSLKSLSLPDHTGVTKTAAQMIAEASAAWHVSPKVVLTTLQKEQSLIEKASPSQDQLDWAMGAGKTDSKIYLEMKGFGNQIWIGTQKLFSNREYWGPGATQDIDGQVVHPTNASTHALYRYTPHFNGVTSFWTLYWRYFGDPLAP
jgi:peptidoglycan hydrolase CwlO-like protein